MKRKVKVVWEEGTEVRALECVLDSDQKVDDTFVEFQLLTGKAIWLNRRRIVKVEER